MDDPEFAKIKYIEEAHRLLIEIQENDIGTIMSIFWGYLITSRIIPRVTPKCETDLEWSMKLFVEFLSKHKDVIKKVLDGENVDWC